LKSCLKNSPKDKDLAIEFANAIVDGSGDASRGEKILVELLRSSPMTEN